MGPGQDQGPFDGPGGDFPGTIPHGGITGNPEVDPGGITDPSNPTEIGGQGGMTGGPSPGQPSRGSESPRERQGTAVPRRPMEPTPMAGSASPASGGLQPFQPMGSPSVGSMATPRLRGLFGSSGGLQGGGLGVPLDPTSNDASPDISSLIAQLLKGGGGQF